MVSLDLSPSEGEMSRTVPALGSYFLYIAVMFLGDEFKRADSDSFILSGIIFEHSLKDSYIFDFYIFDFFSGKLERAHE
jgi:hypothetical protein